jgi:acyl dehydratase
LIEKHPELGGDYISAMRAAFLAMTFMAPFKLGNDIRAHMAEDWERQRSKGNRSVTKEIEAIKQASHLKLVHSAA